MLIWVIKVGGPVPWLPSEADQRLFRAGQFEAGLREAGHKTIWFSSTFEHRSKSQRPVPPNIVFRPHPDGPDMVFIESPGYQRNFGLKRFQDHRIQARVWRRIAEALPCPDVIFCAYPTIELSAAAVDFGIERNVPVIVDIRDLWPDVIYDRLGKLPFFGRLLQQRWLLPYERLSNRALRNAAALTGVGKGMVAWAQERSGRSIEACAWDRHFYQSQPDPLMTAERGEKLRSFWRRHRIEVDASVFRIIWGGGLYPSIDAKTLFDGLDLLPERIRMQIEVVICGSGPLRPMFEEAAGRLPFIKLVDWVPHTQLMGILQYADAGLMNYYNRFDFQRSVPNKVVDYAAAGLPIITGVKGELATLAGDSGAVVPYEVGDPKSMCATVKKIFATANVAKRGTSPSRKLFEQHFESTQLMGQFADFVETLVREYGI